MSSCEFHRLFVTYGPTKAQRAMDVDNPMSFGIDMNVDMNGNLGPIPFDEDALMLLSPGLGVGQELIEPRPVRVIFGIFTDFFLLDTLLAIRRI
jgi:hypothetical protein